MQTEFSDDFFAGVLRVNIFLISEYFKKIAVRIFEVLLYVCICVCYFDLIILVHSVLARY